MRLRAVRSATVVAQIITAGIVVPAIVVPGVVLPGVVLPGVAAAQVPTPGMTARAMADTMPPDTTFTYAAVLTMDQVAAASIHYSPTVALARGAVRTGLSGERVAYGSFLPSVTFNASALQTSNQTSPLAFAGGGTTPPTALAYAPNSYVAGIFGSYEIFTGGRRPAQIAASKAATHAADATLIEQKYNVTLTAEQTAYGVLRGHDLVQVTVTRIANATKALEYASAQLRAGTATRADVLTAQVFVEQARQQFIAAQDTLSTNAYALGRLVGIDGAVGVVPVDSVIDYRLALSDSEIIALAVSKSPTVTAADQNARASHALVNAARTEYVPNITLSGGYNWANRSLSIGATREGWLIELGTSFPLFNGFLREDDVTRATVNADVARAQASDTHRFARSQAEQLLASLRLAQKGIDAAGQEVAASEENLRVMFARYRNGVATFLDLSTAQVNDAQARVDLVTARYTFRLTRVSLEALLGRSL
jgi:outer membrane protein